MTGATDGIGKEYARQVSDSGGSSFSNNSKAEQVDDDEGPVAVASARNSLVD